MVNKNAISQQNSPQKKLEKFKNIIINLNKKSTTAIRTDIKLESMIKL